MTTIYLVRHAEAEGNLYRRIHGHFEGGITPKGLRQLRELSRRFSHVHVDVCYSSDLIRTQMTAQAICVPNGIAAKLDPSFREVHLGCWEDVPFGALYTFHNEQMENFNRDPRSWIVEGAERFDEYTDRFLKAMERIIQAHPDETVAIVSHGAVIRGIMMALFPDVNVPHADNTSVSCLHFENGTYQIAYLNDNSHLQEKLSTLAGQSWWRETDEKKDVNLWFEIGAREVKDLSPALTPWAYTAMAGHVPVGLICLSEPEKEVAEIIYLGLEPGHRRKGLAVQLFGQAVYAAREKGKRTLLLSAPSGSGLEPLMEQMELARDSSGYYHMDLTLRVCPLE